MYSRPISALVHSRPQAKVQISAAWKKVWDLLQEPGELEYWQFVVASPSLNHTEFLEIFSIVGRRGIGATSDTSLQKGSRMYLLTDG
jgi:hypothetical protein